MDDIAGPDAVTVGRDLSTGALGNAFTDIT
jgi:hypothetical protein